MATALVPRIFHRQNPVRHRNGFSGIDHDLDAFFNGFFGNWPSVAVAELGPNQPQGYLPRVHVEENEKDVRVSAEIPGVDEKDLSLTLSPEGDVLVLKGEKKLGAESVGTFERHIRLPDTVETDKVEAKLKNGVLAVTLPKRQPEPPREIKIKVA